MGKGPKELNVIEGKSGARHPLDPLPMAPFLNLSNGRKTAKISEEIAGHMDKLF